MFRDLLYLSYKDCGEWKPQLVAYNYAQVPVEGDFLLVSREKQTAKRFFDLYGSYARFVDYCGKGIGRVFERAYLWGGKNVTRHMTRLARSVSSQLHLSAPLSQYHRDGVVFAHK